jgi:hypothetical protein
VLAAQRHDLLAPRRVLRAAGGVLEVGQQVDEARSLSFCSTSRKPCADTPPSSLGTLAKRGCMGVKACSAPR